MGQHRRYPELRPLGLGAIVVRFSDQLDDQSNRAAIGFSGSLRHQGWAEIAEVASALSSTLVRFDPLTTNFDALWEKLREFISTKDWYTSEFSEGRRLWTVPVALGGPEGPQFDDAALIAKQTVGDLTDLIRHCRVRVLALGFAPGQPYMGFLPKEWDIPRLPTVTPEVPAGALVMAVRQLIVFSGAAPTGWRQIGLTGFRPFRPDAENPITLSPGDEMCFCLAPADELDGDNDGFGGAMCQTLK